VPRIGVSAIERRDSPFGDDFALRYGWDLMYTPSASRWADWYVTVGTSTAPEVWVRETTETGDIVSLADRKAIDWEVGLKFTFNVWGGFKGIRVGTRWSGIREMTQQRLVLEGSLGVW